ncbi:hypothetical protein EDC04DRAFT_3140818 [Pisolithus marmoratus]|nr:hypothetical protein EDC04DRAFT_3140818 [Pisolithus marmoratus]
MKQCFNMVVWLEGTPPALEVGYKSCVHCRSLLKSWYEDITAECMLMSHVSLLDSIISIYGRSSSRHGSPTAESLVTRKLGPLMKKHGPDVRYLPSVNKYPHGLREHVAKQWCESKDDFRTVGFPGNICDGSHDPWVVLVVSYPTFVPPAIASFCLFSHDCLLRAQFGADVDDPNWDWVCSDQEGQQFCLSIAVFVAVSTFLQSKGADLYGCHRCQVICKESFVDTSSVALEVANSGEHEGLGLSWLPTRGAEGAMEEDRSSPFQGSLEAMQEPAGMKRQYADSLGVNMSDPFELCLEESALWKHLPEHGTPSSSKLSKSDKVEKIKDRLLEMLRTRFTL